MAEYGTGPLQFLTIEQTFVLIELFHEQKCLWDVNLPKYKDQKLKKEAWATLLVKFISKTGVECTDSNIRKKICSLRSNYTRELRLIHRGVKNGEEGGRKTTWPFFGVMGFLRPVINLTPNYSLERGKATGELDDIQISEVTSIPIFPKYLDESDSESCEKGQTLEHQAASKQKVTTLLESQHCRNTPNGMKHTLAKKELKSMQAKVSQNACQSTKIKNINQTPVYSNISQSLLSSSTPQKLPQGNSIKSSNHRQMPPTNGPNFTQNGSLHNNFPLILQLQAPAEKSTECKQTGSSSSKAVLFPSPEDKQREKEDPIIIWAKSLCYTLQSLKSEKRRRLARLEIDEIVNKKIREELEQDV